LGFTYKLGLKVCFWYFAPLTKSLLQSAMQTTTNLQVAADAVRNQLGEHRIDASLVLGSGLGDLARLTAAEVLFECSYTDINGMPKSSAPTHKGVLKVLKLDSLNLLVFQGRFHLYEGHSARDAAATSYLRPMPPVG